MGVALTGSVPNGEWNPFWSDLDVHAFVKDLDDDGFEGPTAAQVQFNLRTLDRDAYQLAEIQLQFVDAAGYPTRLAPPVRFEVVHGQRPPALSGVSERVYWDKVHADLDSVRPKARAAAAAFAGATDDQLVGPIRRLSSLLKDTIYANAVLIRGNPISTLALSRRELLSVLRERAQVDQLDAFYRFIADWKLIRQDPPALRGAFDLAWNALWPLLQWNAGPRDRSLLGRKVREIRISRGFRTHADLADECARQGKPVSLDTIRTIESTSKPYHLPGKFHSGQMALELVADVLRVELVEILKWRSDDEITESIFAPLLPETRRRRALAKD